jgi:DDE_Tnp_1-associated/Transposase DDE domain
LAGARSVTAIAEWAAEAPQPVRAALVARRDAPGLFAVPAEATIRRTLARLDPEALAGAIGAWLTDRNRAGQPPRRPRALAVDGKTLRGARRDGRQVHLLACMDHTSRAVLAQRRVDGAPGEVPGLQPLLVDLDLADVVVTADALQTHPQAAEFLVTDKQAHYLLVVKANQPTLLDRCQRLPWQRVPVLDRTRDRGHGRIELRTLKVVSVHHFGFPHTAQVIQVTRKTRELHTRRWRTVQVDLGADLAEHRRRAADGDRHQVGVTGVAGGKLLDGPVDLVLVAGDPCQHQCLAPVIAAQRGSCPCGPVGGGLLDRWLADEFLGERGPCSRHGGVVDRAVRGGDQQDQVGVTGAEDPLQFLPGATGLGVGVAEPATGQALKHPTAQRAGDHGRRQRAGQHPAAAPDGEPA